MQKSYSLFQSNNDIILKSNLFTLSLSFIPPFSQYKHCDPFHFKNDATLPSLHSNFTIKTLQRGSNDSLPPYENTVLSVI